MSMEDKKRKIRRGTRGERGNKRYSNRSADNPFENYSGKASGSQSSFRKALTSMTIVFLTIVFAIMLFANNQQFFDKQLGHNSFVSKLFSKLSLGNSSKNKPDFNFPFGPRRQNILLLGVDSNGADSDLWVGTRTDTMILLNIDPRTKSVNAISVPRDSKVYLPGEYGIQKINAAHALGGVDLTKQTVEQTLGIKIDRYVVVSDQAVENLVNTLGGVPVYVEKNMFYDDYSGHLHVHLRKGNDVLDGKNAVGYLRFRHDGLGDIGRTQRQQWFLKSLLSKT